MKQAFVKLAVAISSLALLLTGSAALAKGNQNFRLASDQTYSGAYIHAGNSVTIDGTVNGDVIVVASDVDIKGTVNGSVYAAAQTITIGGTVKGNVHLAGNSVQINGSIAGSAFGAASTFKVDSAGSIGANAIVAGSAVKLDGKVGGQVYTAASSVTIGGSIGGDVTAAASNVAVNSGTVINGNLKYRSNSQAQISNDTKITGTITRVEAKKPSRPILISLTFGSFVFGVISSFILGFFLIWLFPRSSVEVAEYIPRHPARSIITGLLILIVVPILLILGLISLIGIPVTIVAGLIFVAILLTGSVFTALWIGRRIVSYKDTRLSSNLGALFVGLVLLGLIRLLPIIGGIISGLVFVVGIGALSARSYDRARAVSSAQTHHKA